MSETSDRPRFSIDLSRFRLFDVLFGGEERTGKRGGSAGERQIEDDFRPDVIVDFEFRDGLLFLSIRNIGPVPAIDVEVDFSPSFTGVGGSKDVTELALFNDLTFLAPGRRIETFLDTSASYFNRDQPTRIKVRVRYRSRGGARHEDRFEHNLEIYREIGFIDRMQPGRS